MGLLLYGSIALLFYGSVVLLLYDSVVLLRYECFYFAGKFFRQGVLQVVSTAF